MNIIRKIFLFAVASVLALGASASGYAVCAAGTSLTLQKPALELSLGESEELIEGSSLKWTSADESVATVSSSGIVRATGVGETTITAENESGAKGTLPVYVIERERGFEDNILISVFWPPTAEYMDAGEGDERWEEQFKLLSDAHIDYLCNVTGRDRQQNIGSVPRQENTKATNLKMALYAHKYGMRVSVADERFSSFPSMSSLEIQEIIGEYRNVAGVGGYYILDEPFDPMPYAPVHEAIKLADATGYTHLNFQPIHAYGIPVGTLDRAADERYRAVLGEWLGAGEACGFPHDYLMFDFYPYTDAGNGMARDIYFANLDAVREVGLEYGVKTANYLQTVSSTLQSSGALAFRSATAAEIRYEAMLSLAYGCKQLSYFTWFLPTNRNGETFTKAIVNADGVPDPDYYGPVTALNAEIHNLGRTLIGLDAEEVYLNGERWGWQEGIPQGTLLSPTDEKNYTVSLLKDRETQKDYFMVVNNDYTAPLETGIAINREVSFLKRIRPDDGKEEVLHLQDGILSVSLAAGDGALFYLPDEGETEERPAPADPSQESGKGGCGSAIGLLGGGISALILLSAALLCAFPRGKGADQGNFEEKL